MEGCHDRQSARGAATGEALSTEQRWKRSRNRIRTEDRIHYRLKNRLNLLNRSLMTAITHCFAAKGSEARRQRAQTRDHVRPRDLC